MDLFEKRYKIYNETVHFIQLVDSVRGSLTHSHLSKFSDETQNKDFLFGKEIKAYLKSLFEKGNELIQINKKLNSVNDTDERSVIVERESDIYIWFGKQYEESKRVFGKYLSIDKK